MITNDAPTLWARVHLGKYLLVWCPSCRREHYHGGRPGGHRAGHCQAFEHGYVLVEQPHLTAADIREHNEQVVRHRRVQ